MSDTQDLTTPPWGAFGAPAARRVAWGSPVDSEPATPTPAEPRRSGDEEGGSDLGDLFASRTPTATPSSQDEPDQLADLFGPAATQPVAPSPSAGSSVWTANDTLPASTVEPSDPRDASGDQLDSLFVQELTGSHGDHEAATPPAGEPVGDPQPEAAPAPQFVSRLAAQREAVQSARAVQDSVHPAAPDPSSQLALDPRYARAAQLEPYVDRLLGLGGSAGVSELSEFMRHLELTRNRDVDHAQRARYESLMRPMLLKSNLQFRSEEDLRVAFDCAYDEMLGIGPLGPLWRDDSITEIMVSGPDKVTVERRGRLEVTPVRFRDLHHLESTARRLGQASADDRPISPTNPLVTIHLPGARVQFVWRPLALNKVVISIRKFGELMGMGQLLQFGSLTNQMAEFLSAAVRARATILVSGGTGAGKTTAINALSEFIPDSERVITIEDALELQLRNTHVEALVTKESAGADDHVLFGQDQLLKASLRLNPDRIIVGEIRDGKGATVMLEAANTGHDGTMTTIHANSPTLALRRLAKLVREGDSMADDVAREEVATAIDLVVQVVKVRGRRFISHISTVNPDTFTTQDVFRGDFHPGAAAPTFGLEHGLGADTAVAQKMSDAGIDPSAWRR